MANEEQYLNELIERMCDRSDFNFVPGFDSTKTISWKATREAEKLSDERYIPLLKKVIDKETDDRKRDRAYFILGHIAMNVSDPSVASFFIQRIPSETGNEILSSMLLNLKPLYKPKGTDIQPLLQLAAAAQEEVRQSAIQALAHCDDKEAEATLVNILQTSNEKYDLLYAMEALRDSGSSASIAAIKKHSNSKDKELRTAAAEAVSAINSRKK